MVCFREPEEFLVKRSRQRDEGEMGKEIFLSNCAVPYMKCDTSVL